MYQQLCLLKDAWKREIENAFIEELERQEQFLFSLIKKKTWLSAVLSL